MVDIRKAMRLHRRLFGLVGAVAVAGVLGVGLLWPASPPSATAAVAPSFTAPLLDGSRPLSLLSLRGHPVLLNFWASYCAPCKDELPFLQTVYRRYHVRGVVVLGVDAQDDARAQAQTMARHFGLTYPIVSDKQGDVADRYTIQGTPMTVFIDATGHMRGVTAGGLDQAGVACGLGLAAATACPAGQLQTSATDGFKQDGGVRANAVFPAGQWHAYAFSLTDQFGRRVSLSDLRGRVVALTFLSSVCRAQCPIEGRQLARIAALLRRDRSRVAFVTISVQPETDMPAYAADFAMEAGLDRRWEYVTGLRSSLVPVWRAFGVGVAPPPAPNGSSNDPVHSLGLYLIDTHGDVRAYFDAPLLSGPVTAAMRALL